LVLESQGLDLSGRSARLVSMVLPVLSGATGTGRYKTNKKMESHDKTHSADTEKLRAGRFTMPPTTAPSPASLGL